MAKARILAVDDQLYFRSFIEGLLVAEGYEVRTAASGDEALHALERQRFEVVITDLVMPGMDGHELVRRIKERDADQEVVVLTGVGDVRAAVAAMKLGATDYLLKPIERPELSQTLEGILQRRRLREEHARLMVENLEYMGVLSLYERAMGLFETRAIEPLAERIAEGLCLETRAQGAVVWLSDLDDSDRLRLAGARGLVRLEKEPEELSLAALPEPLARLGEREERSCLIAQPGETDALYLLLRHGSRCVGLVRLTDKLEGAPFHDRDLAAAEKFAELAAVAVEGALRLHSLERRALRDPTTRAYTLAFFDDVVRNEIHKASRFSRSFSVLKLQLAGLDALRASVPRRELELWLESLVLEVGHAARSTDLVAAESEELYRVLLPETGALGAVVLKRRIAEALERSQSFAGLPAEQRPQVLISTASFPADGTQLDSLVRVLEARLGEERGSLARELPDGTSSFSSLVDALLERGEPEPANRLEQVGHFLLEEVARRPRDCALLFLAPGSGLSTRLRESLERLRGLDAGTEVVLVSDEPIDTGGSAPVTRVSPRRARTRAAFLIYYGEGPAYALLRRRARKRGDVPLFHTSDRALVERLAFQLQGELGISLAAV